MSATARYIANWKDRSVRLSIADGLLPRKLYEGGANDSLIHAIGAVNQNTIANTAILYQGRALTAAEDMGVGAIVDGGAAADTITRTAGDFVADGWRVGDAIIISGSTSPANDVYAVLTGVAATTLTMATGTVGASENIPNGAKLYRAVILSVSTLAVNAGNVGNVPAVDLIGDNKNWTDVAPDRLITLPKDCALFVAAGTALTGVNGIHVIAKGGDY